MQGHALAGVTGGRRSTGAGSLRGQVREPMRACNLLAGGKRMARGLAQVGSRLTQSLSVVRSLTCIGARLTSLAGVTEGRLSMGAGSLWGQAQSLMRQARYVRRDSLVAGVTSHWFPGSGK